MGGVTCAQSDLLWQEIKESDGLSSNYVYTLTPTDQGELWIGTENGLSVFDGYSASKKSFLSTDTASLETPVYLIKKSPFGHYWLSTRDGLRIFDPENKNWIDTKLTEDKVVEDIYFLNDRKVLVTYYLGFYEIELDQSGRPVAIADHALDELGKDDVSIINEFFLDDNGMVYISIIGYGVVYGPMSELTNWYRFPLLEIPFKSGQYKFDQCLKMMQKNKDTLLIDFIGEGLFEWDIQTHKIIGFKGLNIFDNPDFSTITTLNLSGNNLMVVQLNQGLLLGNVNAFEQTKRAYDFSTLPDFNHWSNQITSIEKIGSTIWLTTLGDGIKWASLIGDGITIVPLDEYVKKNTAIYSLKTDHQDDLWIGTNGNGLLKMRFESGLTSKILQFDKQNNLFSLHSDSINEIHFSPRGPLWIATNQGVAKYDHAQKTIEAIDHKKKVEPIWYKHGEGASEHLSSNMIHDLFEDKRGNLYLTSLEGLNVIANSGTVFNHKNHGDIPYLKENRVIYYGDFFSDSTLLLSGPLVNYVYQRNELMNYNEIFPNSQSLYVQHMARGDSADWVGTTRGLYKYDSKTGNMVSFPGEKYFRKLKLNAVEFCEGMVWMGTNQGLFAYDIKSAEIYTFPLSTGSGQPYFHLGSVTKNNKGQVFFGTSKGVVAIDVRAIRKRQSHCEKPCRIIISKASLNQRKLDLTTLKESVNSVLPIELGSEDLLELKLGFPIYHIRDEVEFEYSLDGSKWIRVASNVPKILLHRLSSDSYNLKIRALAKGKKMLAEMTLPINVISPWYWRWWALVSYLFFAGLLILVFIRLKLNRVRQIQRWELAHNELRQRQEANDLKFEFISNISHELRTPLTLMLNDISNLNRSMANAGFLEKIRINASRLKRLANEMLDLKGIGNEQLKLTVGCHDMVVFLRERVGLFDEVAKRRKINLQFLSSKKEMQVWFNPHQFEKVIFNLLTNAFKFTPDKGTISVNLSDDTQPIDHPKVNGLLEAVRLQVNNSGSAIAVEDIPKIFETDYSVQSEVASVFDSAGIGLHLCKKIIELHYGRINVDSSEACGTTFTVELPLGHFHYDDDQLELVKSEMSISARYMAQTFLSETKSDYRPSVLTVEDNAEIMDMLKQIFANDFDHQIATNGIAGIEMARSCNPDIIITDLSMPGKSGVALINEIRKDEYLSHTPIIVLTSYSSDEQQIAILNQGADAFITKPFDPEVLLARVKNLLSSRSQLKEMFSDKAVSFGDLVRQSPDSELLKRVITIVEKNMTNPDFDVAMLAEQLKMSRSLLYLKLSNLTNYSPKEFIHVMRVRKGAKLLKSGTFRVKEVAYYVGYNSQKNFRKYFKDYHGVAPSEYVKHMV